MHTHSQAGTAVRSRIGHEASYLLIVSIVAVVIVGLFPPPGLLMITVPLVLFGFVLLSWALLREHDRNLCELCVFEMPLDPAGRASRLGRRFWTAHTGSEPRFLIPYLVLLIGSNFTMTTPMGRLAWALIQLSMVYLILSQRTHRTLQPWCPWCSEGGGGQDVDETPPVLPHDDRVLS